MQEKASYWDRVKFLANDTNVKADTFFPLNSIHTSGLIGFDGSSNGIHSQQDLIDIGYGSNVSAYSIIKKIAQTGASIKLDLYKIDKSGKRVLVDSGELFEILKYPAVMQGKNLTQYDWMEIALTYLLATGNLYQRGVTATGFGDIWQQLEFLPSGITTPIIPDSFFKEPLGYEVNDMVATKPYGFKEVIHTKFVSLTTHGLNYFIGLSPLQAAMYSLTGSTDIQKAISVMVKNQGVRGVLTNESERSMTAEERDQAQNIADAKLRGTSKFNKVMVSNSKMNYLQIGMSATDLKIIESGVLTDRQLCNAYSFPSVLLNDPANTSYNNQRTALESLYRLATIPVVHKILQDVNSQFIIQWSKRDKAKYELCMDTSGIEALQPDQIIEAQKDKTVSDAIIAVLIAPITQESKIQTLVYAHGIDEDKAKLIVGNALPPVTKPTIV